MQNHKKVLLKLFLIILVAITIVVFSTKKVQKVEAPVLPDTQTQISDKVWGITTRQGKINLPVFIEGCESEGCQNYTIAYPKAIKAVDIYSQPSLSSKIVDKLNKCESISNFHFFVSVQEFGKAKFTNLVDGLKLPGNLKLGDIFSVEMYVGEGMYLGLTGNTEFNFSSGGVGDVVEVLKQAKTEGWAQLTTPRGITGYVPRNADFYLDYQKYMAAGESSLCAGDKKPASF